MTLDQFVAQASGVPVDVDMAYGDQCWDLVALYNQEVIGIPASQSYGLPTGPDLAARDVYEYFKAPLPDYFDKLPVSATPQQGDLVVWGGFPGNPAGHIAIFMSGTRDSFVSFDQNWPVGSAPHPQEHNGSYVIGYLRPKGGNDVIPDQGHLDAMFQQFFGRNATDDEVREWVGKKSYTELIDVLESQQAYKEVVHTNKVGGVAIRDDWQGQIESLQKQVSTKGPTKQTVLDYLTKNLQ